MRPQTQQLAAAIRALVTDEEKSKSLKLQERVDVLKDAYKGEDCWVIATGPSATALDMDKVREKLRDRLVITFKQAYDLYHGIADFHVNSLEHSKPFYDYVDPKPITIGHSWGRYPGYLTWNPIWDISLMASNNSDATRAVCYTKDFEPHRLDKTLDRPLGPNIVDEYGFYLPVHFGCKRIFTMGFDLEPYRCGRFFDDTFCNGRRDDIRLIVSGQNAKREWLLSLGIEWYRIVNRPGQATAPHGAEGPVWGHVESSHQ